MENASIFLDGEFKVVNALLRKIPILCVDGSYSSEKRKKRVEAKFKVLKETVDKANIGFDGTVYNSARLIALDVLQERIEQGYRYDILMTLNTDRDSAYRMAHKLLKEFQAMEHEAWVIHHESLSNIDKEIVFNVDTVFARIDEAGRKALNTPN